MAVITGKLNAIAMMSEDMCTARLGSILSIVILASIYSLIKVQNIQSRIAADVLLSVIPKFQVYVEKLRMVLSGVSIQGFSSQMLKLMIVNIDTR